MRIARKTLPTDEETRIFHRHAEQGHRSQTEQHELRIDHMSLHEVLQRRGYPFRQHLEEEGWTRRKLTVVDLDDAQRVALEREGVRGLREVMEEQGLWSFPAVDIENPLPVQPDLILVQKGRPSATVVVPESDPDLQEIARNLVDGVEHRFGLRMPLLNDAEVDLGLLKSQHLIVVGGSHQNRLAMEMALRYQTCFVDASVPPADSEQPAACLHALGL